MALNCLKKIYMLDIKCHHQSSGGRTSPGKFLHKMMDLQRVGKLIDAQGMPLPLIGTYMGQMATIMV